MDGKHNCIQYGCELCVSIRIDICTCLFIYNMFDMYITYTPRTPPNCQGTLMLHSKDCVPQVKVTSTSHWGAKKHRRFQFPIELWGKKSCTLRIHDQFQMKFTRELPMTHCRYTVYNLKANTIYMIEASMDYLTYLEIETHSYMHLIAMSGSVSLDSLQHLASSKNSPMERSVKNHAEVAKTTESRSPVVSAWPNRGFIRVEGTNPSSLGFGWPGLKNGWFQGVYSLLVHCTHLEMGFQIFNRSWSWSHGRNSRCWPLSCSEVSHEVVISLAQSNNINVDIHLDAGFLKVALAGVHHRLLALRPISQTRQNCPNSSRIIENLCGRYFENCMRIHVCICIAFSVHQLLISDNSAKNLINLVIFVYLGLPKSRI